MRTLAELITAVRLVSRNVANPDGTYSLSDTEITQYLNDAQDIMQNKLSSAKNIAKIFVCDALIPIVQNQAGYTIPDRVLLNKQIEYVEFSATGNTNDFVRLEKVNFFNRDTYQTTYPNGYFKRGNQIVLQPLPSTSQGTLRIMYERQLDDLAPVIDVVDGTPTDSEIVVTTGSSSLVAGTYFSIIGADGTVRARNVLIDSYDAMTKTITPSGDTSDYLQGNYALADLDTCSVVSGRYVTHISQLPDMCETYLIHSAASDVFRRDSSNDYDNQKEKADSLLKDIISAYASQTGEVQYIPQAQRYEFF